MATLMIPNHHVYSCVTKICSLVLTVTSSAFKPIMYESVVLVFNVILIPYVEFYI